jgi:TnpA family transposase
MVARRGAVERSAPVKRLWTQEELVEHWTLTPDELALLDNKAGATRLGFVVLLKGFRYEGKFPAGKHDVPAPVVAFLARQVGVPPTAYLEYDWRGRAIKYHRAQLREHLGVREATVADAEAVAAWLGEDILSHAHRLDQLRAAATGRFRALGLEPPTAKQLNRLVRAALHRYETRLGAATLARLTPETVAALDALVATRPAEADDAGALGKAAPGGAPPERREASAFAALRADPGAVGLASVAEEIGKLTTLRALGLPPDLFRGVGPAVLEKYRQRAGAEWPRDLRAHPAALRATLLAAFCTRRAGELVDGLVELLLHIVHRIGVRAERRVERELLDDFKRVTGKHALLFTIAEASLDRPDEPVRAVIYPAVGEQTLRELVKEYKATGPAYRRRIHTVMRASYRHHYRRLLPVILAALDFRSNNEAHRPVVEALELLKRYAGSKARTYGEAEDVPLAGVVRTGLQEFVFDAAADEATDGGRGGRRINRINYEIAVLHALRDGLRCKEIWVAGADRFRDPDEDRPADFDARRAAYYEALNQPQEAEAFVAQLQGELRAALGALDATLPTDPAVSISRSATGQGRLKVAPLAPQPAPVALERLKAELAQRWPMTSLLDMLKEADLRVGFTKHFASVAGKEQFDPATLQKRLLLCLYGLGTNTGLRRVSGAAAGAGYGELRYVRRRFVTREALRAAIAGLVDAIFAVRRPEIWGEGTTACASDSKKFAAWDQNLLTEWHVRYRGPGVMIYWHVERRAVCIHSQLKACSSSEVAAMIEGVLRHCTQMTVEKHYVDSHGQSEVAFAFTRLLGFRLLPRLKHLKRQKLYRPEAGQPDAYPNLQPVLTRPIDWDLIRRQYDELVKYATALRLGTADAEAILRRFTRANVQHPTYRALAELGKAQKTLFLCQYLSSEPLRREIHEGLNVIENWNSANGFIFYGRGGEFATNRPEQQEVAMLCLHLTQLALEFVNVLMLQRLLAAPDWADQMAPADWRGLTPLLYHHVTPYGAFALDLAARLPLDDPAESAA